MPCQVIYNCVYSEFLKWMSKSFLMLSVPRLSKIWNCGFFNYNFAGHLTYNRRWVVGNEWKTQAVFNSGEHWTVPRVGGENANNNLDLVYWYKTSTSVQTLVKGWNVQNCSRHVFSVVCWFLRLKPEKLRNIPLFLHVTLGKEHHNL